MQAGEVEELGSDLAGGEEAGEGAPVCGTVRRGYSCSPSGGQELVRPQTQAPQVVVQAGSPQAFWNLHPCQHIPFPASPGPAPGGPDIIIEEQCG